MKCAIYCRVSTEEQAQKNNSIPAQLEELREYASSHGYSVFNEYVDAGFSGGLLHRPALDQLLADAKTHSFDVVLFVKLDRWFRSVPHYYKIQEVLEANGINWVSTQEDYETITSSGRFKVNIMLSVSQQFKDATSERVKSVFDYKLAVTKEVRCGSIPYGYSIVDKHYVVNPDTAPSVVELFKHCLETQSLRETHRWWVASGYDPVGYRAIRQRLLDKRYIGLYEYNGVVYDDYYPPIIDSDLFYQVQALIDGKRTRKMNSTHDYMFSGIVFCSECGSRCTGSSNGYQLYYRCNRNRNGTCHSKSMCEAKIEKYVLAHLEEYVHCKYEDYHLKSINPVSTPVRDNTSAIRSKQARLKDLYIDGVIGKKEFDSKYKDLESQIKISKPVAPVKDLDLLMDGSYLDLYNKLDSVHKNLFFKNLIDKIVISPSGDVFLK